MLFRSDGGETDQEVLAIYRWWKYQRPADRQREDDLLMVWHEASPRSDEAHQVACAAEDENDNRDQEMLHRLIDVRRSMWT